jgi:hypothetical protein
MLHGSCACGATEYEVEDAFTYAMNCHCSKCRAATGSAYKPMGGIEREKVRVTREDTPMFVWGGPDASDFRCGVCGSFLYSVVREGKHLLRRPRASRPLRSSRTHLAEKDVSDVKWHTFFSAARRKGRSSRRKQRSSA